MEILTCHIKAKPPAGHMSSCVLGDFVRSIYVLVSIIIINSAPSLGLLEIP